MVNLENGIPVTFTDKDGKTTTITPNPDNTLTVAQSVTAPDGSTTTTASTNGGPTTTTITTPRADGSGIVDTTVTGPDGKQQRLQTVPHGGGRSTTYAVNDDGSRGAKISESYPAPNGGSITEVAGPNGELEREWKRQDGYREYERYLPGADGQPQLVGTSNSAGVQSVLNTDGSIDTKFSDGRWAKTITLQDGTTVTKFSDDSELKLPVSGWQAATSFLGFESHPNTTWAGMGASGVAAGLEEGGKSMAGQAAMMAKTSQLLGQGALDDLATGAGLPGKQASVALQIGDDAAQLGSNAKWLGGVGKFGGPLATVGFATYNSWDDYSEGRKTGWEAVGNGVGTSVGGIAGGFGGRSARRHYRRDRRRAYIRCVWWISRRECGESGDGMIGASSNSTPGMQVIPWPPGFGSATRGRNMLFAGVPFMIVMAIVGICMSLAGVREGSSALAVFGLLGALFALAIIPLAIRIFRAQRRSYPNLRVCEVADGESGVSVPRWYWFSIVLATVLVAVIAVSSYYAFVLLGDDTATPLPPVRGPLAPMLLIGASLLAALLLVRTLYFSRKEKGLWLTSSGIRLSSGQICQVVDWDELLDVQAADQPRFATIKLVSRPGGVDLISTSRWARTKNRSWLVEIYTLEFDVDSALLYHVIRFYWRHPELRGELASEAAIARVRRGEVLDQSDSCASADRKSQSLDGSLRWRESRGRRVSALIVAGALCCSLRCRPSLSLRLSDFGWWCRALRRETSVSR